MKIFTLPDLGEGLPDAEIREWYVKVGDTVKADTPMVAMETAKAVVDVPAPRSGTIEKLYGEAGDVIDTGNPLVEFTDDNASDIKGENAATVAGDIEVSDTVIEEAAAGITPTRSGSKQVPVVPAVRALAKKLGVDLGAVTGSGPGGRITAQDVEAAASSSPANSATETLPLRGVRRAMHDAMVASHQHVVPVTINDDANISAWNAGEDITCRILRAIVVACDSEPSLNAHFDGSAVARCLHQTVNIGMAVDTEEGLLVPVIKDAGNRDLSALRAEVNRLKTGAKDRSLPQEDLQGGTITLSNFGSIAGRYANPIVVPPTVATIGTGKLREEVVAIDGEAKVQRMLPLSLTMDHRGVTGGEAARFLAAMMGDLGLAS